MTIPLAGTKLLVSPLCMGTANHGTSTPDASAFRQLDFFLDSGGNFIDTARVYGDWGKRGPGIPEA